MSKKREKTDLKGSKLMIQSDVFILRRGNRPSERQRALFVVTYLLEISVLGLDQENEVKSIYLPDIF